MVSFLMQDCEIRFIDRKKLDGKTHIYIYIYIYFGELWTFCFWAIS